MPYSNLPTLTITTSNHIATLTLNHPPINLLDEVLATDLDTATLALSSDPSIRILIIQSAITDFFIAHSGLHRVASASPTPQTNEPRHPPTLRQTQVLTERLRTMPAVVIAKVEGIARGGGSEVVLGADMTFAARGQAVFGQPEIGIGLVPGGGSTQRLPRLVGRARAMEILLGGEDFSAERAEQWGWINRALEPEALGPFVEGFARKVAGWPAHALRHVKRAVNEGVFGAVPEELLVEAREADECVKGEVTRERVKEGLELGMETRDGELNLLGLMACLTPTD